MAAEPQFAIGARVTCTDGHCGEVRRIVFDPNTETVTHLVIQPGLRKEAGRLVPVRLVESTDGEISLRCTRAEFDRLDHAEDLNLVTGPEPPQLQDMGAGMGVGLGWWSLPQLDPGAWKHTRILEEVIPVGEDDVRPGDGVHAVDGEIGRVRGFLVNPGDERVTHVLLQEGHPWGRKEIAIPVSAVTGMKDGIRLNLTKEQVGELPPVA
jgi:sporulation protein YlmC with PRC-barrel domain